MLKERLFSGTIKLNHSKNKMNFEKKEHKKKLISISDLNAWLYCPRKVYLTKVCNLPTIQNRNMVIGRLKHNILEAFSKQEEKFVSKIDKDFDKLDLLFLYEDFLKSIANIVFIENMQMINKFMIDRDDIMKKVLRDFSEDIKLRIQSLKEKTSLGIFKENLWNSLENFYISELRLESENLGLKGRVDRILISKKDNSIIPFELKSREDNIFHSDEIQLTAYAMLLEDKYRREIKKGIVEAGNNRKEILITENNRAEVLKLADEIRNIADNPAPPIQSNFNKCRNCEFSEECLKLK